MDYVEALACLEAVGAEVGSGVRPNVTRIKALTESLGNPQDSYFSIQIAGTNGKSSTTRMIAAILGAHGLTTGFYTSPHLQSPRERFGLAGLGPAGPVAEMISREAFAGVFDYLTPFIEKVENEAGDRVTYFETTTAMAFTWMAEIPVAAGVFEAGLGGVWDATNLVDSAVAVLTHVDVDHVEFLGATPLLNATEKVGIVKPDATVISAEQERDVVELINRTAGARVKYLGRDFEIVADEPALGGRFLSVRGLFADYEDLTLPLFGPHQSRNLALAIAACEGFLDRALDALALTEALGIVTSAGRMEILGRRPLVVIDGAHNPDGAAALAEALGQSFPRTKLILIAGISEGKDSAGILKHLLPLADRVIFTRGAHPRSADPSRLPALGHDVEIIEPLPKAIDVARDEATEDEMILVAGSLFLAGEARDYLVGPLDQITHRPNAGPQA